MAALATGGAGFTEPNFYVRLAAQMDEVTTNFDELANAGNFNNLTNVKPDEHHTKKML